MNKEITPWEWVLVFLYAGKKDNENPVINGVLMFTKQFFVFVKEIKKELDAEFKFIPYDYGPYSFILINILQSLVKLGYIAIIRDEERQDFIMTEEGMKKVAEIYESIDGETKKKLESLRREATQLGYSGVLRYVYSRYPEYTTASKIRERVLNGF
jgi:uncharacterized protein YwgA